MGQFANYALNALGVGVPEDYARFMESYGSKLPEDPVNNESSVGGLGNSDFVVGTTLAFRSQVPRFRKEQVVIGYSGLKTIIVNKAYEELDEYVVLDTRDGSVALVDSLGTGNRIAARFEDWIGPELLRLKLREKYGSNLTVVVFDDERKAGEARLKLLKLEDDGFVDLEDVVVVVKERDGTARFDPMHRMATKGGLAGSVTGFIVGSLLLHPLLGMVFGAVTGAISGSLTDVGIDEEFVKDLAKEFEPGCSALFTLLRKADADRVTEEFFGFGGKVLVNSMSREREAEIQEMLAGVAEDAGEKP